MISMVEAKPGQGKTTHAMMLIDNLCKSVFRKYTVASNVPTVYKHERYIQLPLTGWEPVIQLIYERMEKEESDIIREGSLVIVLDELSLLLNARNWDNLPFEVQFLLRQHRHFGVDIVGYSQSVQDIDVSYRRLVQDLSSIHKLFVFSLPFVRPRRTWGFFMQRHFDSDDVEVKRAERQSVGFPSFYMVDPYVYDMFDSWHKYERPAFEFEEVKRFKRCELGHKHAVL